MLGEGRAGNRSELGAVPRPQRWLQGHCPLCRGSTRQGVLGPHRNLCYWRSADANRARLTIIALVLGKQRRCDRHRGPRWGRRVSDGVVWKQSMSSVVNPLKSVRLRLDQGTCRVSEHSRRASELPPVMPAIKGEVGVRIASSFQRACSVFWTRGSEGP